MRILIAYIVLVLLWSVTPLAIKWSGEGPGYLFAVTGRMATGLSALLAYLTVTRTSIPWDRRALWSYLAGALQIYGSMILTYWASQHLPSGWIAVVVIGGMGSIMGSIVTGLTLGLLEGLTKVFYAEASGVVIFVIMAIVLLLRPAGLFGKEK